MKLNDEQLLAETYKMNQIRLYVEILEEQGKSEAEIKDILVKEGLWDSIKAGVKTLNPFGKSQSAQVAKDRYKNLAKSGVAKLAKKGIDKGTDFLKDKGYISPETATDIKKSKVVKDIGNEGSKFSKTQGNMRRTYSTELLKSYNAKFSKMAEDIKKDLGRSGLSDVQIENMLPDFLESFKKALNIQ